MGQLIELIASNELLSAVFLNSPVTHVRYSETATFGEAARARVTCATGLEVTADAVVVTVPLGVLQANALRFEPPLAQVPCAPQLGQRSNRRLRSPRATGEARCNITQQNGKIQEDHDVV
jgi:monoamine oxidase